MASLPKPMHHGRRLFELLEEQQEPFLLDVYLLEHGYSDRAIKADATFMCWPSRLRRIKRKRGTRFLRCLLSKVVYNKVMRKAWRWETAAAFGAGKWSFFGSIKGKNDAVDFHRLSYSGGIDEDAAIGSSNQLSPVSVLELHSDEVEEELSSTSTLDSPNEVSWGCFCDDAQKPNRKRHFFEPHHFVLDCHECSVPEILLPCESQTAALSDISKLIDSDLSKSRKEWIQFQHDITEVGVEIEHIIFEEIRDETLLEILF
ncbi:hypothetical protein Cni_G08305 [Canna indica]|uniref:Uncharacterized protein n=1 Tax=Canna indica TaxID=4628 RepID=A0AAQ3Q6M8_9LILI|nr:hypothetical protein Cni_G08305 [Canna indica]